MSIPIDLSIITTAYNEEKNLLLFLSKLKSFVESQKLVCEIIFVDDGSSDSTWETFQEFDKLSYLKSIRQLENHGTGHSIKNALAVASGTWYVWLPSDLEVLPSELVKPLCVAEGADVVVTYFSDGATNRTFARRFLSKLFTLILNFTFKNSIPYYNGPSLIKMDLIKNLNVNSNRFFFHAELLIRVLRKTPRTSCVPIKLTPRFHGKSKALQLMVLKDLAQCFLKTLWDVKFRNEHSNY